jgi:hypothetical protein
MDIAAARVSTIDVLFKNLRNLPISRLVYRGALLKTVNLSFPQSCATALLEMARQTSCRTGCQSDATNIRKVNLTKKKGLLSGTWLEAADLEVLVQASSIP